jgi:DNA repair ATPase RecN
VLDEEERVHAIAQMLSGENPSQHAIANAREMIKS